MSDSGQTRTRPPASAKSQRQKILARLREAGPRGVLASEFYYDPSYRYGRSPRNRVRKLRAMSHKISGKWETKVKFRYPLIEETEAPKALPDYGAQKKVDWYESQTGQRRPIANPGPLFDGDGAVRQ